MSAYAFGHSVGFLSQESWSPNFKDPTEAALQTCHINRWFPSLKSLDKLAVIFLDYLPADLALMVRTMQIDLPEQIEKTRDLVDSGMLSMHDRHTIFAEILTDGAMESKEKETDRLAVEAFAVMGAGTETTASALAIITYELLKTPEILAKLTAELGQSGLISNPRDLPSFPEL